MKKTIGILSLILATTTFSQGINENNKDINNSKRGFYKATMIVEEKHEEFIVPGIITQESIMKSEKLVKDYKVKQEMLKLDIEKIDIQINQEMLYDIPSQRAINRLIDDKVKLFGKLEKNKVNISFKMDKLRDETEKELI